MALSVLSNLKRTTRSFKLFKRNQFAQALLARQKYSVSPVKNMRFLRRLDLNNHLSEVTVLACGWYMLRGDELRSARAILNSKDLNIDLYFWELI